MKPVVTAALALAGAFVAYEVWGRSPASKAKEGVTVAAPLSAISPAGLDQIEKVWGADPKSWDAKVFIFVTSVDDVRRTLSGRISHIWTPEKGALVLNTLSLTATVARASVLSLGYPANLPGPVTTL
jgi:hypothetical protein